MSLIIKPPSWGHCTTNLTGTPNATVFNTTVTSGANNADGSSVAILSNIAHDVEFLVIGVNTFSASTGNGSTLLDVLVDPAGGSSWATDPLISDLLAGETLGTGTTVPNPLWYFFPVWLKSGNSIGARARSAHTAALSGRVAMYAFGGNRNPGSWWCGQHVTSIGINAASSQGTNHTPGSTGTFSSWTDFGSTLPAPCGALQFAVQGTNTDTTQTALSYFFEFGISSTRIGPPLLRGTGASEAGWTAPTGPIFYEAPSASQLQVRATCSTTPVEILDVAAYAVH